MQADAQKAADHNGYDQIIRPSLEKGAGLKILCSSHNPGRQQWDDNVCLTF
jgi:hypothetical protein